jgi:O-antigen ligase
MRGVWDYFIDHPSTWIFGSGWCSSYAIVGFYPHNGPVQVLGELGVVGAAVWWSSIIFVFTRGLRLALLANRVGSRSLDVVRPALALMVCTFLSNLKAGDCVDIWLALTLSTVSQLIRRFRPESEKSLLR